MTNSTEKKLSIIIPVFNNYKFTKRCINDLLLLPNNHEIIIVDNGSTDETKSLISKDRLKIIRDKSRLGFSRACNLGYINSVGEHIMFLNNDIKIMDNKNNWTEEIIKESEKGKLVGPTIGILDNNFNFICESSKLPTKGLVYMSGWNLTASRNTWNKLITGSDCGPFSTEFSSYFEDTDLSFRAKQIKIEFSLVKVPVSHLGRMTSNKLGLANMYLESKKIFTNKWISNNNFGETYV